MDHVGEATYCPEDNKLRLYPFARLDKETFTQIKAAGFKWAPKQGLFVAPAWTPQREDILLELCGDIGDEDYSPEERSADRAERFSGYRDKRAGEADASADAFQSGPKAFGYQSAARAERAARKHDRKRAFAVDQWRKAEYWQERTAAVIGHALYRSEPAVRRGRILELEADLRRIQAKYTPQIPRIEETMTGFNDSEPALHVLCGPKGRGAFWVRVDHLESIRASYARWEEHYRFRIEYERSMLAAEGGSVAEVEIVPGGFLKGFRVVSVTKSPATGRVVSVTVRNGEKTRRINVERMGEDAYRAPTAEDLESFNQWLAEEKKKRKENAPTLPILINPTDEDAEKLQSIWNSTAKKPSTVWRMTQAEYSNRSKGDYSACETAEIDEHCHIRTKYGRQEKQSRCSVFKIRKGRPGGGDFYGVSRVVILTDKPQKPLPWSKIEDARNSQPTENDLFPRLGEIAEIFATCGLIPSKGPKADLLHDAEYCGLINVLSASQWNWTERGAELLKKFREIEADGGATSESGVQYPASICVER